MLPRRTGKQTSSHKTHSTSKPSLGTRPVFTESPKHYRQPLPSGHLPIKASHPLPASRATYDLERMYPLSSTSLSRQGRDYGYSSDRPQYQQPQQYNPLHQERRLQPTSSGQLSQNRSRYIDPESTRSFEMAVGMSSTDDLGTSDRGSRRPMNSNSSQLIRTFSGEEMPQTENDVDFERTLVSLQSRMKNLQSKYLEMANYYRAQLSKRKHGEAPETAAGAELLKKLQEENAQADQELRAVYDARQGYLNKKLLDLTGEVENYRKENNILKSEIQSLLNGRAVGSKRGLSRASSKAGAKSPHTPKTTGGSKKASVPTPPPRTLVGDVNSSQGSGRQRQGSQTYPVKVTGERLLARIQDLTRNLQDDIQIEQERRGATDMRRVFRKHLEKVKDAVSSTFDSNSNFKLGLSSAYDSRDPPRNLYVSDLPTAPTPEWSRALAEMKQQLETNGTRISKILSSLKHKASLSKLDLDKVDLQVADMHGFIEDKLSEVRARPYGATDLSMLKEKLKLLEINCEQVTHRTKLAEKEVDVAQNINDESEILRTKLFKHVDGVAPRSTSHGRQQPQQGRTSSQNVHLSDVNDSRISEELHEAQRINTQLLEDLKQSKDQTLANLLEKERLERRVQEQERELEEWRGRDGRRDRILSPPKATSKRVTRPSSALNDSLNQRALSPSQNALCFENQEMRLKIKNLEQELRRANRSISKQRNNSQAPSGDLAVRQAQEENEENRSKLRKVILQVKKFFLSFRRLQRALHKREESDISKFKVEFEACRHELRDYVDHLQRRLDQEDDKRKASRSFNISGVSKRSGSAAPHLRSGASQPSLTPTSQSRFTTQQQGSPRESERPLKNYCTISPEEGGEADYQQLSPMHGNYVQQRHFDPVGAGGGEDLVSDASGSHFNPPDQAAPPPPAEMADQLVRELKSVQGEQKQTLIELKSLKEENHQLRKMQANTAAHVAQAEEALKAKDQEMQEIQAFRARERQELTEAYNIASKQASQFKRQVLMLSQEEVEKNKQIIQLQSQIDAGALERVKEQMEELVGEREGTLRQHLTAVEAGVSERENQIAELEEQVEKITRDAVNRLKRLQKEKQELKNAIEKQDQEAQKQLKDINAGREKDLRAHNLETTNMQNLVKSLKYELNDLKRKNQMEQDSQLAQINEKLLEKNGEAEDLKLRLETKEAMLSTKETELERLKKQKKDEADAKVKALRELEKISQEKDQHVIQKDSIKKLLNLEKEKTYKEKERHNKEKINIERERERLKREKEQLEIEKEDILLEKEKEQQHRALAENQARNKELRIEELIADHSKAQQALKMSDNAAQNEIASLSQKVSSLEGQKELLLEKLDEVSLENQNKDTDHAKLRKELDTEKAARVKKEKAEEDLLQMVKEIQKEKDENIKAERSRAKEEQDSLKQNHDKQIKELKAKADKKEKQALSVLEIALKEEKEKEIAKRDKDGQRMLQTELKRKQREMEDKANARVAQKEKELRQKHEEEIQAKEHSLKNIHASSSTELEQSLRKMLGEEAKRKELRLKEEHQNELNSLKLSHQRALQDKEEILLQQSYNEKQALEKEHNERLEEANRAYHKEKERIHKEHNQDKDRINKAHNDEKDRIHKQHSQDKERLSQEHKQDKQRLKKEHQKEKDGVEQSLKREKEFTESSLTQEKQNIEKKMQSEKEQALDSFKKEKEGLLQSHDKEKKELEKGLLLKIAEIGKRHEEDKKKALKEANEEKANDLKEQEEALKGEMEKRDQEWKKQLEQAQKTMKLLSSAIDQKEKNLSSEEEEKKRLNSEMQRQLVNLQEAIKAEKAKREEQLKEKEKELKQHKKEEQTKRERLEEQLNSVKGEKEKIGKELNETLITSLSDKEHLHTLLNKAKTAHEKELQQQKELHDTYHKEQQDIIAGLKERIKGAEHDKATKDDALIEMEKKWMEARDADKNALEKRFANELAQERQKNEDERNYWEKEKEELLRSKLESVKKLQDQLRDEKEKMLKEASDSSNAEQQRLIGELQKRDADLEQLEDELMSAKMVKNSLEAQIEEDSAKLQKLESDLGKMKARAEKGEKDKQQVERREIQQRHEANDKISKLENQLKERDVLIEEANVQLEHFNAQKMYIKGSLKQLMLDCSVVATDQERSLNESELTEDIDFEEMLTSLRQELNDLKQRVRSRGEADISRINEKQHQLDELERKKQAEEKELKRQLESQRVEKGQIVIERDEANKMAKELDVLLKKAQANSEELVAQRSTFESKKEKYKEKVAGLEQNQKKLEESVKAEEGKVSQIKLKLEEAEKEREIWRKRVEQELEPQLEQEQQKAQDLQEALEMSEDLAKTAQEQRENAEKEAKNLGKDLEKVKGDKLSAEEALLKIQEKMNKVGRMMTQMAEINEDSKQGDYREYLATRRPEEIKILRRAALNQKSWVLVDNIPDEIWIPEHRLTKTEEEKLRNALIEEDNISKVLRDLNNNYETNIKMLMEERAQLNDTLVRVSDPGSVSPGGSLLGAPDQNTLKEKMRANKAQTEIVKLEKKIGELVALIDGLPEDQAAKTNAKRIVSLTAENEQLGERYEQLLKEMRNIEMSIGEEQKKRDIERKTSSRGERPPMRPQSVKGAQILNSPGMSYVEERAGTEAPRDQFMFEVGRDYRQQESMFSIRSGSEAFQDLETLIKRLQQSEKEIQESENTQELLLNQNKELKKVIMALEKKLKKLQNKEQETAFEHGRSLLAKFLKGAPYASKELEQILLVAMNILEFSEKEIAAINIARVSTFGNMKEDKKKKGGLLNIFQKKKK